MQNSNLVKKIIERNKEKPFKKNRSKVTDVSKNFQAETLYIGSRGKNTKVHLRIYDKKAEQLS